MSARFSSSFVTQTLSKIVLPVVVVVVLLIYTKKHISSNMPLRRLIAPPPPYSVVCPGMSSSSSSAGASLLPFTERHPPTDACRWIDLCMYVCKIEENVGRPAGRLNFPRDAIELENVRPRRPLVWALSTPSGGLLMIQLLLKLSNVDLPALLFTGEKEQLAHEQHAKHNKGKKEEA
ncbi:conserved hypothetical protein [Trichinella spiralis]|uniref:hypothetical protein n=1 Tax=Trichinella spiralis TaxID=6334 RepID=UPI0001EFC102|nr:conserved hypothetical protein [Trichinella spiralis]